MASLVAGHLPMPTLDHMAPHHPRWGANRGHTPPLLRANRVEPSQGWAGGSPPTCPGPYPKWPALASNEGTPPARGRDQVCMGTPGELTSHGPMCTVHRGDRAQVCMCTPGELASHGPMCTVHGEGGTPLPKPTPGG